MNSQRGEDSDSERDPPKRLYHTGCTRSDILAYRYGPGIIGQKWDDNEVLQDYFDAHFNGSRVDPRRQLSLS